jgi:hypothetical protein
MHLKLLSATIAALVVWAAPAAAQEGRGGSRQGVVPCVNPWQLPSGCEPPTAKPFNPHDLTGVWTRTMGAGSLGNNVPMTPAGQAKFITNKPSFGPRMVPPAKGNDPMGKCDPLGLVRNILLEVVDRSFEFTQMPDRVMQYFEWAHQYRTIWTDGRVLPNADAEPRWMGYSVGKWDGDTFVVETTGLDARTWLDNLGHPHTEEMRVQERYTRPDRSTLKLSFTITDPKYYPQPYVSDVKTHVINPERAMDEKLETFCVPSEEEVFNKGIRDPAAGLGK